MAKGSPGNIGGPGNQTGDENGPSASQETVRRFGTEVVVTHEMVEQLEASIQKALTDEHGHETEIMQRERCARLKRELREMQHTLAKQQIREGRGCSTLPQPFALLGGEIRLLALRVCEHPYFDPFIMFCIVVNCVFLALADPMVTEEPAYQVVAGRAFLYVFTFECLFKLTSLGELYFDDYWNWLDIVVVLEGWFSEVTSGGGVLSGLKTLRILRPLRVANRLPALKKIITAMLASLPAIFDTFVVFFFFLLIFSMLCVMLWKGSFHYRCKDDASQEWVNTDELCFPAPAAQKAALCGYLQFLDQPYSCEAGETCAEFTETPEAGSVNFDNLGYGILTLFAVSTMEGWAGVLFYTQDVMTEGTFLVFLVIIFIGNFTIVNLMIAAILVQLSGHEEKQAAEDLQLRLKDAEEAEFRRLKAAEALKSEEAAYQAQRQERLLAGESHQKLAKEDKARARVVALSTRSKVPWLSYVKRAFACCARCLNLYDGFPRRPLEAEHWSSKARWWAADDASPFSYFIQGAIVFNLGILALDSHGVDSGMATFLEEANLALMWIFIVEMGLKLMVVGLPEYVGSKWNLFDGFIVTGSILEWRLAAKGGSSLSALRVVRMLRLTRVARLAKLAQKWKSLQDVLKLISKSSQGIGPVLLLLVLFMFIFTILAMQMFGGAVHSDDFIRFDSFYVAYVQCFFVIIGEAWVDIMYVTMADAGPFSSLYFVLLIITGSFILVNLILAEVLSDSSPNSLQKEMGLKLIEATLQEYRFRCAFTKLRYNLDEGRRLEARREALKVWHGMIAQPPQLPPSSETVAEAGAEAAAAGRCSDGAEDTEGAAEHADEVEDAFDVEGSGGGRNSVLGGGEGEGGGLDRNSSIGDSLDRESHVMSLATSLGVEQLLLEPLPCHLFHYPMDAKAHAERERLKRVGRAALLELHVSRRSGVLCKAVSLVCGNEEEPVDRAFIRTSSGSIGEAMLGQEGRGVEHGEGGGGGGGGGGPPGAAATDNEDDDNQDDEAPERDGKENAKLKKKKKKHKRHVGDNDGNGDSDAQGVGTSHGEKGKGNPQKKTKKKKGKKKKADAQKEQQQEQQREKEEEPDSAVGAPDFDLATWEVVRELGQIVLEFSTALVLQPSALVSSQPRASFTAPGALTGGGGGGWDPQQHPEYSRLAKACELVVADAAAVAKAALLSKSVLRMSLTGEEAKVEDKANPTSTSMRVAARASLRRGSNTLPGSVVLSPKAANQAAPPPSASGAAASAAADATRAAAEGSWRTPRRSFAMLMGKAAFKFRDTKFKVGYHAGAPRAKLGWPVLTNEMLKFDIGGVAKRALEKEAEQKKKRKYLTGWAKAEADATAIIFSPAPPLPLPREDVLACQAAHKSKQATNRLKRAEGGGGSKPGARDSSRPTTPLAATSMASMDSGGGVVSGGVGGSVTAKGSQSSARRINYLGADEVLVMKKSSRLFLRYRKVCKRVVNSRVWHELIMVAILVSCVAMVATDDETPFNSAWFLVDCAAGLVFLLEVFFMWGYSEYDKSGRGAWVVGFKAYLHDPWNKLDLAIVCSQVLMPVFRITKNGLGYSACQVVRSFRPLRVINRVESVKATVTLLFSSIRRLGTLILFWGFSMTAYAVVGMHLLKGMYWYCEDGDFADDEEYESTVGAFPFNSHVHGECAGLPHPLDPGLSFKDVRSLCAGKPYTSRPCAGSYLDAASGMALEAKGTWRNPTFHFDDFPNSFLSVFVLSTEGWAEIVWSAFAATRVDYSGKPYFEPNMLVIFYVFFGVSFFGLYMLNLFIGVVFDQYNEMKALTNDGKPQKADDRNWEEYRRRIYAVKKPEEKHYPTSRWRKQCAKVATHPHFSNCIVAVIALNAVTLAVNHRDQPEALTAGLEWSNVAFAGIFVVEAVVKIAGIGGAAYFGDSTDVFDFVVTSVSALDSMLFITNTCADSDSAFLRFVRSMRTFRLMRLVNLIPGCADIMLACKYAAPRLLNVCVLLSILVFFFANVGVLCFQHLSEHGSRYANFTSVKGAMQLLFVIMTGDAWTDYMGEMIEERPDLKSFIVTYFFVYLVVQYFVIVNLFVMVVCEAFEILSEENRKIAEKMFPVYQLAWAKVDPELTGFVNHGDLEALIRLIPEPIGVSYPRSKYASRKASLRRAQTKANYLRRVPGFQCSFTECLEHILFLWLVEVGGYRTSGVSTQVEYLAASIVITHNARVFLDRRNRERCALLAALDSVKSIGNSSPTSLGEDPGLDVVKKHVPRGQSHLISIFGASSRPGFFKRASNSSFSSVGSSKSAPGQIRMFRSKSSNSRTVAPSNLKQGGKQQQQQSPTSEKSLAFHQTKSSLDKAPQVSNPSTGGQQPEHEQVVSGRPQATTPIKPPSGPPPSRLDFFLPPGWVVSHSSTYDTPFYYHEATDTSSWIKPSMSSSGLHSTRSSAHGQTHSNRGHTPDFTTPMSNYNPESDDGYDDSLL